MRIVIKREVIAILLIYILDAVFSILPVEQQGPIISLEAVEGRSIQIPCNVSSADPAEKTYMVLWFKGDTGIPIYSFDVRGVPMNKAHHKSAAEVFGSRAFFRSVSEPASLVVEDIRRHDQGMYRCRVDFRDRASSSFRYNLTIIVPPERPTLFDRWGRQLNGTIGPLDEGDDVMITCRVVGGNPEPKVRWLLNGKTVDEEYEHNAGDVIENRLIQTSVSRKDLNSVFTCEATNTWLTDPQETAVILDLRLRPLTIELFASDTPLIADRRYDVVCVSTGSRPSAIITWYKANKQLRRVRDDVGENLTRSELNFIPSTDDNSKTITCRAENPNATGLFLEKHWRINVIFPPIVSLKLGSTLKAEDIKEGDDVYFECHVKANPPWKKLSWLHNGSIMNHNTSARIIRSHHSLVLQRLTRHSAGRYACLAANSQGETYSNELTFRVQYAPSCRHDKAVVIGASRSESLEIYCEIEADPPAQSFRWKFNNSGETLDVGPERFSSNQTVSVLRYTPVADLDYGTLSCWAQNAIGLQSVPCIFQLVAAAKPQNVQNCTLINNQTSSSVEIKCSAGYDGGLPQVFVLEVYTSFSVEPVYNFTATDAPTFKLEDLETDVLFRIVLYAVNSKGRSSPIVLEEFSFKDPEKRTAIDRLDISSSVFGIAAGTIIVVTLLCSMILFNVYRSKQSFFRRTRRRSCSSSPRSADQIISSATAAATIDQEEKIDAAVVVNRNRQSRLIPHLTGSNGAVCEDVKNPDLITDTYGTVPLKRKAAPNSMVSHSTVSSTQNLAWESSSSNTHLLPAPNHESPKINERYNPIEEHMDNSPNYQKSIVKTTTIVTHAEVELNGRAIKETLMSSKLPESCV